MSKINYDKFYHIENERTGGAWNETIKQAEGAPRYDAHHKLIGGHIKMTVSYYGGGGGSSKELSNDVSVEQWKAFVNKAVEIEQRKQCEKQAVEEAEKQPVKTQMDNVLDNFLRNKGLDK